MKKFRRALAAGTAAAASFLSTAALFTAPALAADARKPPITRTEITARDFATFTVPGDVKLYRVSFSNQYGMEIVGNLFVPAGLKAPGSCHRPSHGSR